MAPKRELSDVTPVELAGAAAGRTRENNGLNAKEIVEVLSAAGIPPKRRRKENEKLLLVNLTTVLETRGWSNEKVTDDIVERCGPIRNWDAWADDVVVKALHEERKERGDGAQTELTQTTITGQKMKPATQGAAVTQQVLAAAQGEANRITAEAAANRSGWGSLYGDTGRGGGWPAGSEGGSWGSTVLAAEQQYPPSTPPPPPPQRPWWTRSTVTCWKCGGLMGQALEFGFEMCLRCHAER